MTKEENKKAHEVEELLKKTEEEVKQEMKNNIQKDKAEKEEESWASQFEITVNTIEELDQNQND